MSSFDPRGRNGVSVGEMTERVDTPAVCCGQVSRFKSSSTVGDKGEEVNRMGVLQDPSYTLLRVGLDSPSGGSVD